MGRKKGGGNGRGNNWDKFPLEKREAMFSDYLRDTNLSAVARKHSVNYDTMRKYRDKYKWNDRIVKIREKAVAIVDKGHVKQEAINLKYTRYAIQKLMGDIKADRVSKVFYNDLAVLIRLEEFLKGNVDAREEQIIKVRIRKIEDEEDE